jgi:hypothetical protein
MENILAKLLNQLWPATKPPDMADSQQRRSEDYQKILKLQEEEKELRKRLKNNENKFLQNLALEMQMENKRSTESDHLVNPKLTLRLLGLSDLREMADFWSLMDEKYLDYYALCNAQSQTSRTWTERIIDFSR